MFGLGVTERQENSGQHETAGWWQMMERNTSLCSFLFLFQDHSGPVNHRHPHMHWNTPTMFPSFFLSNSRLFWSYFHLFSPSFPGFQLGLKFRIIFIISTLHIIFLINWLIICQKMLKNVHHNVQYKIHRFSVYYLYIIRQPADIHILESGAF